MSKSPKRVLILTFEYGPLKNGGLAMAVTGLCRALKKSDYQPVVVLPRSGSQPPWKRIKQHVLSHVTADVYFEDGVEIWLLDNAVLNNDCIYPEPAPYVGIKKFDEYGERLAELLPRLEVDLIHLQDVFGYKCLYAARMAKLPTVMTVHRLHYDEPPASFAEWVALSLVDVVTTVSASYQEENAAAFAAAKRSLVIENGVDTELFRYGQGEGVTAGRAARRARLLESLGLAPRPTFAYVGRMDGEQKGIDVLSDAFARGLGDVNFLFVGEGEVECTRLVQRLAEADPQRVRFVNQHVPSERVREVLAAVDFAVIPSRYEPFGLVQLEAMAMGAIPVASRTGGLKDVIVDLREPGGFGRLFTPSDAPALAEAIRQMAQLLETAPAQVDALREAGAGQAQRRTNRRMAERYEALYTSILGNRAETT